MDKEKTSQAEWVRPDRNPDRKCTDFDQVEIALLCFPGYQATTVHGLTDLFQYATHFAQAHSLSSQTRIRVTHWRERAGAGSLECFFDTNPGIPAHPAVAIVPASQLAPMDQGRAAGSVAWVKELHSKGAIVAAVCGGVFLLAETGLLNGRRATTHWMFADELRRRFPELQVAADRVVIDDGDIVTAGGVLAWADLGLCLVERLLGPTVMTTTARFMLADPCGREQRFYASFLPRLQHGDHEVLAIQHWLQTEPAASITIRMLAERVGLGERTFLRRFMKATGLKPSEYQQRLRVARARELLEFSRDSVDEIAAATGYRDAGGFRKTFRKIVGLSPIEYRRRFQLPSR